MLKGDREKMETPLKPANSGMGATGAEEEKGYFAGQSSGAFPRAAGRCSAEANHDYPINHALFLSMSVQTSELCSPISTIRS
uniref:Uncharacterized protein n=1 Tax=Setaria viridis TaxID=4556 RepID=A0A4U6TVT0_SETVI|nr:hypothetical protein SEVIR_7G273500v2 [Setaria viridis]